MLAERESSFVATVQDGTPYRWTALDASLNLIGTLRISQITYLPPTSLADLARYDPAATTSPADVYSVRAVVRTVTANNKLEDYVVACFPLDVRRLTSASTFTVPPVAPRAGEAAAVTPGAAAAAAASTSATALPLALAAGPSPRQSVVDFLPQRTDAFATLTSECVLPRPSDIATKLNVHVGLDGVTELRVEGPGTVVFSGEEKIGMLSPGKSAYTVE